MSLFCQTGYTLVGGTKCLKLVTTTATWSTGQTACLADGGTLASITTTAQNSAILTAYTANLPFWIGFTDAAVEGTFVWVDGTSPSYTNWFAGEPENTGPSGSPANCVIVNTGGAWYDRPCGDAQRYLCQTRPITCRTGYTLTGDKCTRLVTTTASFTAAQATCVTDGGSLVTLPSAALSTAIYTAYTSSIPFWIGYTDSVTEGTFLWSDATTPGYNNWATGEPNNQGASGGEGDCVVQNTAGTWFDRLCTDSYRYVCQTPQITNAPTSAPTTIPSRPPTSTPTTTPSLPPTAVPTTLPTAAPSAFPTTLPTVAPTAFPTTAPTTSPTFSPTYAPTIYVPSCTQFLSFDDTHGGYATWATSFLKYDGYFDTNEHGDFNYDAGYIPFQTIFEEGFDDEAKPAILLSVRYGPGATFSVVPGKLDSQGHLLPCEIESIGSGPCLDSHAWEIGLTAKSFLNSFLNAESSAWTAPYGSSMTNECFPETELPSITDSRLRPAAFTGKGRSNNNNPPPSFHVPPPLPHDSVEFSLTLKDGGGFGWWNTLKLHSNQYVLDDGENAIHLGTLVDKAEDTQKFRLRDGSYSLRMQGNLDSDAGDDTWSLSLKDREIASGGRFDRVSFTVFHGELNGIVSQNVLDTVQSATYPLAAFDGLVTAEKLASLTNNPTIVEAESVAYTRVFGEQVMLTESSTFNDSLNDHPVEFATTLLASAMVGMVAMFGILRFFSPSTKQYNPVMDHSSQPPADIELEQPMKKVRPGLLL